MGAGVPPAVAVELAWGLLGLLIGSTEQELGDVLPGQVLDEVLPMGYQPAELLEGPLVCGLKVAAVPGLQL